LFLPQELGIFHSYLFEDFSSGFSHSFLFTLLTPSYYLGLGLSATSSDKSPVHSI
jgi:hypothetical protein